MHLFLPKNKRNISRKYLLKVFYNNKKNSIFANEILFIPQIWTKLL